MRRTLLAAWLACLVVGVGAQGQVGQAAAGAAASAPGSVGTAACRLCTTVQAAPLAGAISCATSATGVVLAIGDASCSSSGGTPAESLRFSGTIQRVVASKARRVAADEPGGPVPGRALARIQLFTSTGDSVTCGFAPVNGSRTYTLTCAAVLLLPLNQRR